MGPQGYDLNHESFTEDVAKEFADNLRSALSNPIRLYGHRTETMFGYVAAALGNCLLVRREDTGQTFALTAGTHTPDMKLVLRDGRRILVEVKNVKMRDFDATCTHKTAYVEGLRRYASLTGCEFMLAVYWHGPNLWSLVLPEAFEIRGQKMTLTFKESMLCNRMAILGDFLLGAVPPLRCRAAVSREPNGSTSITIEKVFAGGEEIKVEAEKKIAWMIMMHGSWEEAEASQIFEEGRQVGVDFSVEPHEWVKAQGFAFAGAVSSIVSSQFRQMTSVGTRVHSLSPPSDPEDLAVGVSTEYEGEELKLWRIIQHVD